MLAQEVQGRITPLEDNDGHFNPKMASLGFHVQPTALSSRFGGANGPSTQACSPAPGPIRRTDNAALRIVLQYPTDVLYDRPTAGPFSNRTWAGILLGLPALKPDFSGVKGGQVRMPNHDGLVVR